MDKRTQQIAAALSNAKPFRMMPSVMAPEFRYWRLWEDSVFKIAAALGLKNVKNPEREKFLKACNYLNES